jgi:hypothetical protein
MDHMDQYTAEQQGHQGHSCGCHGRGNGKQASGSEAHAHGQGHVAARALDILDERFARGEIEKTEYAEKKQLISLRASAPKMDLPGRDPSPPEVGPKAASAKQHAQRR